MAQTSVAEKTSLAKEYRQEIKSITRQIIEKYKPLKVYLFGSAARQRFTPDSDLDFLVIKEDTPYYGVDRIYELRSLIKRKTAVDFLVYRPDEFEERLKLGDPFLKSILKEGILLYDKHADRQRMAG